MRIGVDLGGTKIEALLLDSSGKEQLRKRVPTPRGEYELIVDSVAHLVLELEAESGASCTVGIGIPGTLSRDSGLVKNANSTELNGRALDRDLAQRLHRPIRIENDANCFALSESVDGAASRLEVSNPVVFGVILGTGVGGGVVVGRNLLGGPDGIAGEWGHNELPWRTPEEMPGPECWCGKSACVETFLAGPSLAQDHRRRTGELLQTQQLAELAERGHPEARLSLELYEDRLARGLASIINLINPNAIVLGGGLSNIGRLYANVPKLWKRYVFSDTIGTLLLQAEHGDSSGVRGAAWLHQR